MQKENTKQVETPQVNQKAQDKPQFISVPVEVKGKFKGKNYVELKGLSYNPELGNLSLHLNEDHTLIFKSNFQRDYMKIVLKQSKEVELAPKKAPAFEKSVAEQSTARMKSMGAREGRTFVGATGSVKYDGSIRGLVVNLDDKHVTYLDSEVLSKELGITVSPIAMEKNTKGLSR
ncbi:MAG: hypothetical protein B7Y39_02600 [Bdellovibrio sp. 28-41-41]|nr:MAG: hypothetical protein B7Y39_02600 [Bdellovibrio sp. 28-41-41]